MTVHIHGLTRPPTTDERTKRLRSSDQNEENARAGRRRFAAAAPHRRSRGRNGSRSARRSPRSTPSPGARGNFGPRRRPDSRPRKLKKSRTSPTSRERRKGRPRRASGDGTGRRRGALPRGPFRTGAARAPRPDRANAHEAAPQSMSPRRASRNDNPQTRRPPSAPPRRSRRPPETRGPRRTRAKRASGALRRASHRQRICSTTPPYEARSRAASGRPGGRAARTQERFGPRRPPPVARHKSLPKQPRAVCELVGGRADPGHRSATPADRPRRLACAHKAAVRGRQKGLLRGAWVRLQHRAASRAEANGPRARAARRGRRCGR